MADAGNGSAPVRLAVIATVLVVWSISAVVSIASDYQTPTELNAMAGAIVMWATGKEILQRNGGGR